MVAERSQQRRGGSINQSECVKFIKVNNGSQSNNHAAVNNNANNSNNKNSKECGMSLKCNSVVLGETRFMFTFGLGSKNLSKHHSYLKSILPRRDKTPKNIDTEKCKCSSNCITLSRKITKMLLIVSSVFMLLNLPFHSYSVYLFIRVSTRSPPAYTLIENCVLTFLKQVYYSSFACNFFLYTISAVSFRNEFKRLFFQMFS